MEKLTLKSPKTGPHVEGAEQSSESDSDTDPEALTTKYLTFKKRLYDLRPELADMLHKKSFKRAKQTANGTDSNPRIAKLQRKIAAIESDILFDRDEAEFQWVETQKSLAKEAAERNRLHLGDSQLQGDQSRTLPALKTDSVDTDTDADDLEVDMLADLFLSTGTESCATNTQATNLDDKIMTVRDFGKLSGLKPRRVLEDACKARYDRQATKVNRTNNNSGTLARRLCSKLSRQAPSTSATPLL